MSDFRALLFKLRFRFLRLTPNHCTLLSTAETGESPDLEELVSLACEQGGGFFDTGERYGSHARTAFGMGWGETERLVEKLLRENESAIATSKPVVATKFTPSPWRTKASDVVKACEESLQRLGVDSIDLYQIQMPDIVKVRRVRGLSKTIVSVPIVIRGVVIEVFGSVAVGLVTMAIVSVPIHQSRPKLKKCFCSLVATVDACKLHMMLLVMKLRQIKSVVFLFVAMLLLLVLRLLE